MISTGEAFSALALGCRSPAIISPLSSTVSAFWGQAVSGVTSQCAPHNLQYRKILLLPGRHHAIMQLGHILQPLDGFRLAIVIKTLLEQVHTRTWHDYSFLRTELRPDIAHIPTCRGAYLGAVELLVLRPCWTTSESRRRPNAKYLMLPWVRIRILFIAPFT